MASYIGSIQIGANTPTLLGSTLYGVCSSSAFASNKEVLLENFDNFVEGITIHVKFTQGNAILNEVTLAVGATAAIPVSGNCVCNPDEVIAFTFEQVDGTVFWRSNHSVAIEIDNNIVTKIAGQNVNLATRRYVDDIVQGSDSSGTMHYKGVSTNEITNGGVESAIINGNILSPETGDLITYKTKEFIWTGRSWQEIGDEELYNNIIPQTAFTAKGQLIYGSGNTTTVGEKYAILAPNITNTPKILYMQDSNPSWKSLSIKAGTWPGLNVTSATLLKSATLQKGADFVVPNVTNVGSTTTAQVNTATGTLILTTGAAVTLGTAFRIPNATGIDTETATAATTVNVDTTNAAWPTINYT